MGFIVKNTETKKFLVEKQGPINLTVSTKEASTVFTTEADANKEASNFDPYELIKV